MDIDTNELMKLTDEERETFLETEVTELQHLFQSRGLSPFVGVFVVSRFLFHVKRCSSKKDIEHMTNLVLSALEVDDGPKTTN